MYSNSAQLRDLSYLSLQCLKPPLTKKVTCQVGTCGAISVVKRPEALSQRIRAARNAQTEGPAELVMCYTKRCRWVAGMAPLACLMRFLPVHAHIGLYPCAAAALRSCEAHSI